MNSRLKHLLAENHARRIREGCAERLKVSTGGRYSLEDFVPLSGVILVKWQQFEAQETRATEEVVTLEISYLRDVFLNRWIGEFEIGYLFLSNFSEYLGLLQLRDDFTANDICQLLKFDVDTVLLVEKSGFKIAYLDIDQYQSEVTVTEFVKP